MSHQKKLLIACVVSILQMALIYLLFGFYFDDYENFYAAIVYADIGEPPYGWWFNDIQFLIFPFLAKLAVWLPHLPVYGMWLCLLNFIWLTGLILLWQIVFSTYLRSANWFLAFSISVLLLLTADSIQVIHSNRISILLSGVSVLLLHYDNSVSSKRRVIYFLIFILGTLSRLHTSFIVLIMLLIFFFVQGKSLKELLLKFYPHLMIALVFLSFYHIHGANSSTGKLIETQYDYAINDKQSFYPIGEMKTAADSAKYIAVTQSLFADTTNLTKEFLGRVVNMRIHFTDWASINELNKQIPTLIFFFKNYWHSLSLLLLLIVLSVTLNFQKAFWVRIAFMLIAFVLIMGYLTLSFFMCDRIFSPMNAVFMVCTLIFCLPVILSSTHASKFFFIATIFSLLVVSLKMKNLSDYHLESLVHEKQYETAITKLGELTEKKVVVFLPINLPITRNLFVRKNHETYARLVLPDFFTYIFNRFAQERTIKKYGFSPLDYTGFYKFLITHKEELIIFSFEERVQLYENYFNAVYGYPLCFEEIPNGSFLPEMNLYRICP